MSTNHDYLYWSNSINQNLLAQTKNETNCFYCDQYAARKNNLPLYNGNLIQILPNGYFSYTLSILF